VLYTVRIANLPKAYGKWKFLPLTWPLDEREKQRERQRERDKERRRWILHCVHLRWVHTCNVTAYRNAVRLQVSWHEAELYLNFHPVLHGVTSSCEGHNKRFPVCYGSPSDVYAASSGFVRLYSYTLDIKEKEKGATVVARQLYTSRELYSGSRLLTDLKFQSVSGLYKKFY
jgi:hypothetical protein